MSTRSSLSAVTKGFISTINKAFSNTTTGGGNDSSEDERDREQHVSIDDRKSHTNYGNYIIFNNIMFTNHCTNMIIIYQSI